MVHALKIYLSNVRPNITNAGIWEEFTHRLVDELDSRRAGLCGLSRPREQLTYLLTLSGVTSSVSQASTHLVEA